MIAIAYATTVKVVALLVGGGVLALVGLARFRRVRNGIVYALLFITLLAFAPPARRERLSLDRILVPRWPWWRFAAEPHAVDRVRGAPLVEPVVVGEHQSGMPAPPSEPRTARRPVPERDDNGNDGAA